METPEQTPEPVAPVPTPAPKAKATKAPTPKEPEVGSVEKTKDGPKTYLGAGIFSLDF